MTIYDKAAKSAVLIAGFNAATGDAQAFITDTTGKLQVASISSAFTTTPVVVNQGAAGTTTLVSASGALTHRIVAAVLTMSADGTLKFTSNGVDISGTLDMPAKGGFVITPNLTALYTGTSGNDLQLVTTGGAAHGKVLIVSE